MGLHPADARRGETAVDFLRVCVVTPEVKLVEAAWSDREEGVLDASGFPMYIPHHIYPIPQGTPPPVRFTR